MKLVTSWPPLGGREGGGVRHELVRFRVERGCGFQPPHEGAVAQLRLRIGPHQLQAQGLGEPLGLLLRGGLGQQRGYEHLQGSLLVNKLFSDMIVCSPFSVFSPSLLSYCSLFTHPPSTFRVAWESSLGTNICRGNVLLNEYSGDDCIVSKKTRKMDYGSLLPTPHASQGFQKSSAGGMNTYS